MARQSTEPGYAGHRPRRHCWNCKIDHAKRGFTWNFSVLLDGCTEIACCHVSCSVKAHQRDRLNHLGVALDEEEPEAAECARLAA